MPAIHIMNEISAAEPHRIPLAATNTSFSGNVFNISMMLENNHPINPDMSMTDQISCAMVNLFP